MALFVVVKAGVASEAVLDTSEESEAVGEMVRLILEEAGSVWGVEKPLEWSTLVVSLPLPSLCSTSRYMPSGSSSRMSSILLTTISCGVCSPPSSVMKPALIVTSDSGISISAKGISLGAAARTDGTTMSGPKTAGRIVEAPSARNLRGVGFEYVVCLLDR